MMMVSGKIVLTQAEIEHNKEYEKERNKLIQEAIIYADKFYGDHHAPLMESVTERQLRDSRWNFTFHARMNVLAKSIVYTEEAQAC
jgi:hypothetical protein